MIQTKERKGIRATQLLIDLGPASSRPGGLRDNPRDRRRSVLNGSSDGFQNVKMVVL